MCTVDQASNANGEALEGVEEWSLRVVLMASFLDFREIDSPPTCWGGAGCF